MRHYLVTFLTAVMLAAFANVPAAADEFHDHIIFITEQPVSSGLGGLAAMDARCQAKAYWAVSPPTRPEHGLDGTWMAILSDSGGSGGAKDRLQAAGVNGPFYNMADVKVAENLDHLFNPTELLYAPIHLNEFGSMDTGAQVWTATNPDGSYEGSSYNDWTSFSGSACVGDPSKTDNQWVQSAVQSNCASKKLYCVRVDRDPPAARVVWGPPHTIFVTSGSYTGALGGLNAVDARCKAVFEAANPGDVRDWKAVLSDSTTNARDRITVVGPVFDKNGNKLAEDFDDLFDGGNIKGVMTDQNGRLRYGYAWTGSWPDGTRISDDPADFHYDWTSTAGVTMCGDPLATGAAWLTKDVRQLRAGIYCIDQPEIPPDDRFCNDNPFVVLKNKLYEVDMSGPTFTLFTTLPMEVNAIGIRRSENVIYGFQVTVGGTVQLVKIDTSGTVHNMGMPGGLPPAEWIHCGDISADGNTMYLHEAGKAKLYTMDLTAGPVYNVTPVPMIFGVNAAVGDLIADWAYRPEDGLLYGGDQVDGEVAIVNPTNGFRFDKITTGLPTGKSYGGAWFDAAGRLFLYRNSGHIYRIDNVDAPTLVVNEVKDADQSYRVDAALCPTEPWAPD